MTHARFAVLTLLLLLAAPAYAEADGSAYPDSAGVISMVRGQPIAFPPLPTNGEVDHVRFAIDNQTVETNDFPSEPEVIETRRLFDRLGLELEVEHTLTETSYDWLNVALASASYRLVVHPLPLIRRVHVFPLVVAKHTHLVGFQLRGIMLGAHVKAWVRGFLDQGGSSRLPLRLRASHESSRTYVVPGGLSWRRGARPHVVFSIGPPASAFKFGFQLRGRVFTGYLRTKRDGDTVIKQTDDWERCAFELSNRGRPPRRASCVYLFG
jgi:hypothetical protein